MGVAANTEPAMSIWTRIVDYLAALATSEGLRGLLETWRTPPERSVAFTIGIIALGAKLAKADGRVTRDEVSVFRAIFAIEPGEEANAARVFNLARRDVAGYEDYARQLARLFRNGGAEPEPVLEDVLEGLFHVAVADGDYHPAEDEFLRRVAGIFGIGAERFACMRARIVHDRPDDPYVALGVSPDAPLAEIRARWRAAVREAHPDRLAANGLPAEAMKLAEARTATLNWAWDEIRAQRASTGPGKQGKHGTAG